MIFTPKYYFPNALYLFVYIMFLIILNIVIKMLGNNDTTVQVDLRKRSSIKDELAYNNIDIQSCMVVLVVVTAFLLSVISVAAAQAPII